MSNEKRETVTTHVTGWVVAALALDFIGIGAWLLAFFGPFPPHPWIFFLFAALALACGATGIVLASVSHVRSVNRSMWGVAAIVFGVAPLIVVAIVYAVMLVGFVTVTRGQG